MKIGVFIVNGKHTGPFELTPQIEDYLSVVGTSFPVRSGSNAVQWMIESRVEHPKFVTFYVSEKALH